MNALRLFMKDLAKLIVTILLLLVFVRLHLIFGISREAAMNVAAALTIAAAIFIIGSFKSSYEKLQKKDLPGRDSEEP